jgi:hypothetical protein
MQARTRDVVAALRAVHDSELEATTALVGWSRLTIACRLRYGAEALGRITTEGLAGRPATYYPGGRAATRPATLLPRPGESAADVVDDLDARSTALQRVWDVLGPTDWAQMVSEPAKVPDLGGLALAEWALLRLTEVEVHGTDLDLGLADWTDTFVRAALPWRIARLARHRAPARPGRHVGVVGDRRGVVRRNGEQERRGDDGRSGGRIRRGEGARSAERNTGRAKSRPAGAAARPTAACATARDGRPKFRAQLFHRISGSLNQSAATGQAKSDARRKAL